jgi:hypothetical protein
VTARAGRPTGHLLLRRVRQEAATSVVSSSVVSTRADRLLFRHSQVLRRPPQWPLASLWLLGPKRRLLLRLPCSLGLSAISQQYFSLRTNQPPTTSQQYSSLRTNQHQPPATSQPNRLWLGAASAAVGVRARHLVGRLHRCRGSHDLASRWLIPATAGCHIPPPPKLTRADG